MLSRLLSLLTVSTISLQAAGLGVSVDASAPAQPISPMIYGVSAKTPDEIPLKCGYTWYRLGGNRLTAYNWETNDSNAGKDWKFQSDDWAGKGKPGAFVLNHLREARERHTPAAITVQMGDWLAGDRKGPVAPGTPLASRFVRNHIWKTGSVTTSPNLRDRDVYQEDFVALVAETNAYTGTSPENTLLLCLDNEPDLWNSTHSMIFPAKVTYADVIRRSIDTARMIRRHIPKGVLMGPASYGWHGYETLSDAPDRNGRDWLETYLTAMAQASATSGTRLLDALSIHFYSEATGGGARVVFEEDKPAHLSEACVKARLHSPRSLWDSRYVEDSWITKNNGGQPLLLIPAMRDRIARTYPGTALAINEYNFGGGDHISGALALLDALGIYAREKIDYACLWPEGPTAWHHAAMAFLRNYDGKGASIGEALLPVTASDTADFSTYAYRSDAGGIQVLVINKLRSSQSLELHVAGRSFPLCRRYVLDASCATPKGVITPRTDKTPLRPTGNRLILELPALSATILAFGEK